MFPRMNRIHGRSRCYSAPFEQNYWCYSASSVDKPQAENGNRVILPASALKRLASSPTGYPLLFELQNLATNCSIYCGVLEFVANEGTIYLPCWLMESLLLQNGDVVRVKSIALPKGTYVKLQPHKSDLLKVPDVTAIKDIILRNFSCLTVGHSILVAYDNSEYYLDVVEAKPAAAAICIEDNSCEIELVPPVVAAAQEAKQAPSLPVIPPITPVGKDKSPASAIVAATPKNSTAEPVNISEEKAIVPASVSKPLMSGAQSSGLNGEAVTKKPIDLPASLAGDNAQRKLHSSRKVSDSSESNAQNTGAAAAATTTSTTTQEKLSDISSTPKVEQMPKKTCGAAEVAKKTSDSTPAATADKASEPTPEKTSGAPPSVANPGLFGRLGRLMTRAPPPPNKKE